MDATMRAEIVEKGLGSLERSVSSGLQDVSYEVQNVSEGIAALKADFNWAMGEVIWQFEQQNRTLQGILNVLQAPLGTAAKELRLRAEDAYRNGWYEEALRDFQVSAEKNYQDFSVHRSLGNIFLYHLVDLDRALLSFQKAAKYARPRDTRQTAEAEYFVGLVYGLQQKLTLALQHMEQAFTLDPSFFDAFYMHACLAALLGKTRAALSSLEKAIAGDARYHARAWSDECFSKIQSPIRQLLEHLAREKRRVAEQAYSQLEGMAKTFYLMPELHAEWDTVHGELDSLTQWLARRTFVMDDQVWRQAEVTFKASRTNALHQLENELRKQKGKYEAMRLDIKQPNRARQGFVFILSGLVGTMFILLGRPSQILGWTLFGFIGAPFIVAGVGQIIHHNRLKSVLQRFEEVISRLRHDHDRVLDLDLQSKGASI